MLDTYVLHVQVLTMQRDNLLVYLCLYMHHHLSRQLLSGLLGPHIVTESILHVDEPEVTALGDGVDSLKVLVRQVNALEVGLHTGRVATLGQHNVATAQTPCDEDLGEGVAALGRNVVEGLVLADTLAGGGHLVLRAEGRVGGGQDAVLEAVLHQLVVGEEGVDLDLVDVRLDLGELEELLEVGDVPVRDTNRAGLAILVDLLHGPPGGLGVLGQVVEDDVLFI